MRARLSSVLATALLLGSAATVWWSARADEMSASDKLRILYSNRFTFTHDGDPLVTIELASGQRQVRISAPGGVLLRPGGEGGAEVSAGAEWIVTLAGGKPAVIDEWTVVERFPVDDSAGAGAAVERWQARGYQPQRFEVGSVFGV